MICPRVAAQQAEAVRAGDTAYTTADEVELLLTHGILHLLGHDHAEPRRRVMFGLQAQLLDAWPTAGTVPRTSTPGGPGSLPRAGEGTA